MIRHANFSWLFKPTTDSYGAFLQTEFVSLLDNYESCTDAAEVVTSEEVRESCDFIDAVMETAVMQETHSWLVSHGKADEDIRSFKRLLYKIWFRLYSRPSEDGE